MSRALLGLLVACGGATRTPAPAPPPSPAAELKALAAELDAQLTEVTTIVRVRRDDCGRMASELRAVFARMERSLARARAAQEDPERARLLTTELRAYDEASAQRDAQLERDFTPDARCARDPEVQQVLMSMPTL